MRTLMFAILANCCDAMASKPVLAVPTSPFAKAHRGALQLASGAALGSVLQGFTMGIIAGSLPPIVAEFGLQQRSGVQGLIAASATYGAIFGSIGSGRLGDRVGRRGSLLISSGAFLVGGVVMTASSSVSVLVLGRLVAGFAAGLASATVNPYIAECAAPEVRGALLSLPQLGVSGGILLSYLVALGAMMNGVGWRLMLGASLLPAILQVIAMLLLPESPRWLLTKGKDVAGARSALARLRSDQSAEQVDAELQSLREGLQREASSMAVKSGEGGFGSLLQPGVRKILFVCCTLQAFQQLCGVNAIVYFTPQILAGCGVVKLFEAWGVSEAFAPMYATILAYLPKIPTALLTGYLIDRLGRRQLLTLFTPLLALTLAALALSFGGTSLLSAAVATSAVTLFGIFFGLSLGPLPNIVASELYPTHARSAGVAASTGVQFACNAFVVAAFPVFRTALGEQATLTSFATLSFLAWVFVLRFIPETKGQTLEAISSGSGKEKE